MSWRAAAVVPILLYRRRVCAQYNIYIIYGGRARVGGRSAAAADPEEAARRRSGCGGSDDGTTIGPYGGKYDVHGSR